MKIEANKKKIDLFTNYLSLQSKSQPLKLVQIQHFNIQETERKKFIQIKQKSNLLNNYFFEDFKQNSKQNIQNMQEREFHNQNSNKLFRMVPFSFLVNTITKNKHIQQGWTQFQQKESDNQRMEKNQKLFLPLESCKEIVDKLIDKKQNAQIDNKRKSISYRIQYSHKENNFSINTKKMSNHFPPKPQQHSYAILKEQQTQGKQSKNGNINRQKGNQLFIIRKRTNSNAACSQRQEKAADEFAYDPIKPSNQPSKPTNDPTEPVKFINYEQQMQINNYINKKLHETSKSPNNFQKQMVSRNELQSMQENIKKLKKRQDNLSIKHQSTKVAKVAKNLKARVIKILNMHQRYFYDKSAFEQKQSNLNEQTQIKMAQNQFENLDKFEQFNQQKIIIKPKIEAEKQIKNELKKFDKQDKNDLNDQHNQQDQRDLQGEQSQKLLKQSYRFIDKVGNKKQSPFIDQNFQYSQIAKLTKKQEKIDQPIQNRKSKISSIKVLKRCVKNSKSSFLLIEQSNSQDFINNYNKKIKEKDKACLTHKIKWRNLSKKKLNSDRIVQNSLQSTVNQQNLSKQSNIFQQESKNDQQKSSKAAIQMELAVRTVIKKNSHKFLVSGLNQKDKLLQDQKTPQAEKQKSCKLFAQTIKSKELIDIQSIPYHNGSKSLIIFEDPGISMIAKTKSQIRNGAESTYQLQKLQKQSGGFTEIDLSNLSPVVHLKKKIVNIAEGKAEEDQNQMQSLQQLYYELKSNSSIQKAKHFQNDIEIESMQEFCRNG